MDSLPGYLLFYSAVARNAFAKPQRETVRNASNQPNEWKVLEGGPGRLLAKGTPTVNVHKSPPRFFFDDVGAKKKLGKKKAP